MKARYETKITAKIITYLISGKYGNDSIDLSFKLIRFSHKISIRNIEICEKLNCIGTDLEFN